MAKPWALLASALNRQLGSPHNTSTVGAADTLVHLGFIALPCSLLGHTPAPFGRLTCNAAPNVQPATPQMQTSHDRPALALHGPVRAAPPDLTRAWSEDRPQHGCNYGPEPAQETFQTHQDTVAKPR